MKTLICVKSQREIPVQAIEEQLAQVCASRHFRQARNLEKFLRYAVAKTVADCPDQLKEYTIGIEVFQRGAHYDPRTDAVVRVQASHLRKKLASYYEEEGLADTVVLELPKGSYVMAFSLKDEVVPAMALTVPASAQEERLPAITVPLSIPALLPERATRWASWARVGVAFVSGLLLAWAWQNWQARAERAAHPVPALKPIAANNPLWEKFLDAGAANLLVYGTPQFFNRGALFLRETSVNAPEELQFSPLLRAFEQAGGAKLSPTEIYTGIGETHGVFLLSRFLFGHNADLRVSRSRTVGWEEVKHANLIFLSSMRFKTLASDLNLPNDFTIDRSGSVINLRPQPGEEREYVRKENEGGYGVGNFAVITIWPSKVPQRRILLLNGNTTWGTLAAAEYVTEPEYLQQLDAHLLQCQQAHHLTAHPPFFQVLLKVEVKDSQPIAITYLTHHDLNLTDINRSAGNATALNLPPNF